MAFSVTTRQTVLWDQIKYAGNPSEFSWVLPVRSGAVVQLSNDEWFAALDAMTQPVITGPVRNCGNNGPSFSCGGSAKAEASSDYAGGGESVQVISQSVVGPYDTVTLKTTDPQALQAWLDVNGYALPDSFRPTVEAYVNEGFDFIALRLHPGEGVQSMQPVRVVTQGADATLPLRMVAAGVGAQVGITLYIVSEGRYEAAPPYVNAVIDDSKLVWIRSQNRSNYQELSLEAMQGHNSRTWLTEFSGVTSLGRSQYGGGGYCSQGTNGSLVTAVPGQSLADIYFLECKCKGGSSACMNAGADAGFDAGCASDPCFGFDDLDVALVGMHPQSTWVTRLRAILPVDALSEGDLHIQASTPQASVSNAHSANVYDDPNYTPCGTKGGCSTSAAEAKSYEEWLVAGAFAFAGAALLRRRRSR
jgi:MYXO-CTERM domain-containing protein